MFRQQRPWTFSAGLTALALVTLSACSGSSGGGTTTNSGSSVGSATAASASAASALPAMSAPDQAAVDKAITNGLARVTALAPELDPPALYVGVWDPAKGSYLTVQGDAGPGQPATTDDHFRIGSITKTFTAAIVMQLVDEGSVGLDDTVVKLLPELAADHPEIAKVTVRSLLDMTSRIPDYMNVPDGVVADVVAKPDRVWQPTELVDAGLAPGLLPKGTVKYSTTNYIILQMIAESVEGKPLGDLITSRLTDPLGMTGTSYPVPDPAMPQPYAHGHLNSGCVSELTGDGATGVTTETDPTTWSVSSAAGGGALTSTLADLGLWADSMSGNALLPQPLQDARTKTTSELEKGYPVLYGLGIYRLGDHWYGHDGEAIGWQAVELHDPATGVSVAMAANACNSLTVVFDSILNELYPDPKIDAFLTSQGLIPQG